MTEGAPVASPSSTGGEGTHFEQHVSAYWLALLAVEAMPPIALNSSVVAVSFQTEHLGWSTDDVLVTARTNPSDERFLACQIKTTLTVGAGNEEFCGTIIDAWRDFSGRGPFREERDALVIITQIGTNVVLRDLSGLLDCARAAATAADFDHRIATPGYVNAQVRRHATVITEIVEAHEGSAVERDRIWRFLRRLFVFSLDLNTATSHDEAHLRSLLASTTHEPDAAAAAAASWNELLAEATRTHEARTYARDELPATVRARHAPISTAARHAVRILHDHAALILDGIRDVIGAGVRLTRPGVVANILEKLEKSRLLLVSGAAGSGKSVAAKAVAAALGDNHVVFVFRAEEFAQPHLNATLAAAQVGLDVGALNAALAGQPRKVIIVESAERLLEKSTRDAFTDLLTLVRNDPSWRLLLTSRDYSVDQLRSAFLDGLGFPHDHVRISALSDEDLEEAATQVAVLPTLLRNPRLRSLLRSPHTLDIAVRMPWHEDEPLPETIREFRARFWRTVVRSGADRTHGLPQRRSETFMELAIRRAQALMLFASVRGLDPEALSVLEADGLVTISPTNDHFAAPAHDVLEDWGVLAWIEVAHEESNGSVTAFAERLGAFPAIRRTFRTWIAELVERDPGAADAFFDGVLTSPEVPAHFRDDTVIAFLRSEAAPAVLQRHAHRLVAHDKQLLRRVIHLLRVGCVSLPPWMPSVGGASVLSRPEGSAWPAVLGVVRDHLDDSDGRDRLLLLRLIEDWARGVSWQTPYPPGDESAAAIALWLVPFFDGYDSEDDLKRLLGILAKIPASDSAAFSSLLRGRGAEERDRVCEKLREIVFDGIEGFSVARDLPDLLIEVATDYILASEEDLDDRYGFHSIDIERFFGIKSSRAHGYFPPSALRGPFRPFLLHHSAAAQRFICDLFNHSASWYAERLGPAQELEPAFRITLRFADGFEKPQWANARLWQLYRGTSVAPAVLETAAMALEAWLLDVVVETAPDKLDGILIALLRASDSVSITAVAASVACAHPASCTEAILVLLSSPECILLDRARMVTDQTGTILGRLPQSEVMAQAYARERALSDELPHRKHDLETAIVRIQTGPVAERVYAILDAHRAALPALEAQTEDDQRWRFALHRIDLRNYELSAEEVPATEAEGGGRRIVFTPTAPDPDLQEVMQATTDRHARVADRIGSKMWGIKVFERNPESYDPSEWRERLAAASAYDGAPLDPEEAFFGDGRTAIAAVCIRDHWDELTGDERAWCTARIYDEIEQTADDWSDGITMRGAMRDIDPAASVIPLLVVHNPDDPRALSAFAAALTHPNRALRMVAARAAGRHLWPTQRDLALRAVHAIRVEATTFRERFYENRQAPYADRSEVVDLRATTAALGRDIITGRRAIDADDSSSFSAASWFEAEASIHVLAILLEALAEQATTDAFAQLAVTLVGWWEQDRTQRVDRSETRSHEAEYALKDLLAESLFRVDEVSAERILQPILDAVGRHSDQVADILRQCIIREDRDPATDRFWFLWARFAAPVPAAPWLADLDSRYGRGEKYLGNVLLANGWKENAREWRSLTGHEDEVHALFDRLPASRTLLKLYLRFLYKIGSSSLPAAFLRLHTKMRSGDGASLIEGGDTAFLLESILLRNVYAKPYELKRRHDLRDAVLYLLNTLVDAGSSTAFRMRDDFVTPLSQGDEGAT